MLVGVLLAAASAHADDEVSLTSGNRMTGTLRELSRGVLSFSVAGAGRIDIDWNNVETLRSEQRLDIELVSGTRLLGTIASPSTGMLEIREASGGTQTVPMQDVVRMTRVRATLTERTTGSADIGIDFLTANSELDLTFNIDAQNRTKNFLTSAYLSSILRRRNGEVAQRRDRFHIDTRRFLADRWFVLGQFEVEDDRELDLDLRVMLGAALGRTLHQSQRQIFALYAGLDYIFEEYRQITDSDDSGEAFGTLEWDWFEFDGKVELDVRATTYRRLDEDRWRIAFDSSIRRYVIRDFYLALNLYESYDSRPPPDRKHSDFGVSLTFGSSF